MTILRGNEDVLWINGDFMHADYHDLPTGRAFFKHYSFGRAGGLSVETIADSWYRARRAYPEFVRAKIAASYAERLEPTPDLILFDECDTYRSTPAETRKRLGQMIHRRLMRDPFPTRTQKESAMNENTTDRLFAANSEIGVLRTKLEAEQRHASNLRVTNAELVRTVERLSVEAGEGKKAFGMVETHRKERDAARAQSDALKSKVKSLEEVTKTLAAALAEEASDMVEERPRFRTEVSHAFSHGSTVRSAHVRVEAKAPGYVNVSCDVDQTPRVPEFYAVGSYGWR